MHKTTVKNLRFGCGASLHSAFLHGHSTVSKRQTMATDKERLMKALSKTARMRGRKK